MSRSSNEFKPLTFQQRTIGLFIATWVIGFCFIVSACMLKYNHIKDTQKITDTLLMMYKKDSIQTDMIVRLQLKVRDLQKIEG